MSRERSTGSICAALARQNSKLCSRLHEHDTSSRGYAALINPLVRHHSGRESPFRDVKVFGKTFTGPKKPCSVSVPSETMGLSS